MNFSNNSLLKEYINQIIKEYKSSFDIRHFKSLKDVYEMMNYVKQTGLHKMGQGSSRAVYLLPNTNYVLKLAYINDNFPEEMNNFGKKQNQTEVEVFTNPVTKNIVSKIYDFDPAYNWLISEAVRPLNSNKEMEQYLDGASFTIFASIITNSEDREKYTYEDYIDILIQEQQRIIQFNNHPNVVRLAKIDLKNLELAKKSKFIKQIFQLIKDGMDTGDLPYSSHYGKTQDGRLVLLDYGI